MVIVEEKYAGGTCLNCGCIPTKSLVHDAEKVLGRENGEELFRAAIARKDAVVAGLRPVSYTHLDVYKRQKHT